MMHIDEDSDNEAPKRRGRPPKIRPMPIEASLDDPEPVEADQVTYLPGPEDPPMVKWAGHVFHANMPKTISNKLLLAAARGNRFFKVGSFDPSHDTVDVAEQSPSPKTPEQYRAHAVAWLKGMTSVDALDTKWASEETLRMSSGAGTDDIEYLMSLIQPKRAELRKQEMQG